MRGALAALALIMVLVLACLGATCGRHGGRMPLALVRVGNGGVLAEVPHTQEERATGLSGRASLNPERGMLFIVDPPAVAFMHMQNMNFPLDFVFCRGGRITEIVPDVQPSDLRIAVSSGRAVDLVLELVSGRAAELGLTSGDPCWLEKSPQPELR